MMIEAEIATNPQITPTRRITTLQASWPYKEEYCTNSNPIVFVKAKLPHPDPHDPSNMGHLEPHWVCLPKPGQCRQPAFNPVNSVNIPCKFRQNVQVKITEEELSLAKHVKAQ